MSVSFGRTTQNSFPSGSARTGQDSAPVCPCRPGAPRGKKAVDLLLAVGGAAGQAGLHAVLDDVAIGDWQETPAGRRVLVGPMTIARSRSEGILRPSAWVQNRASLGSWCVSGHARRDAMRHRD